MIRVGYLMWFDDNPKITVGMKIEDAIAAFVRRFRITPNIVLVSETDNVRLQNIPKATETIGVQVRGSNLVRRNNFWVGLEKDEA